jgi:methyl-accepting chemotaxis protein
MKNMKIGMKLLLAFGIISLLLVTCVITGVTALSVGAGHLVDVQKVNRVRNDVSDILTYAAGISDAIKAIAVTDDPAEKQKILDGIGELRKAYKGKLDAIVKNAETEEGKNLLAKLQGGLATGKVTNQKLTELAMKGDRAGFVELYKNEGKFAFERVHDASKALDSYYDKLATGRSDEATSGVKKAEVVLIIFGVVAVALSFLISALFSASITKPLKKLVEIADKISEGDLTVAIEASGKDETSTVMRAMGNMVSHMKQTLGALSNASEEITSAATELHKTSREMVIGADEVVAQSNSIATAGEEMAATSSEIANSCHITANNADEANSAALEGAEVVKGSIAVMETIANRVKSAAKTVDSLGGRSEQIGEIIGTIEDIADQTNLLALNAAIEAARAGEQGRGFAVVADEVRALAERTTKATREIGEMIKTIQVETKAAVSAMNQGVSEVERGTGEVARSGHALEAILQQIGAVTEQANQIASAVEEQTATTSEISNNMLRITEIVRNSAEGAQETDHAAGKLTTLAQELQRSVTRFRLAS